jgi:hypothetical protein
MNILTNSLPPACRDHAEDVQGTAADPHHLAACPSCAARAQLRHGLVAALRSRPRLPAELGAAAFLENIHERIVDAVEHESALVAPLGARASMPEEPMAVGPQLSPRLAAALANAPTADATAWVAVQQSVMAGIGQQRVHRMRLGVWVGLAGAAAVAFAAVLLIEPAPRNLPNIVFADLDVAPDGDFALIRRGVPK